MTPIEIDKKILFETISSQKYCNAVFLYIIPHKPSTHKHIRAVIRGKKSVQTFSESCLILLWLVVNSLRNPVWSFYTSQLFSVHLLNDNI
jgi:hypothetical protein